LGELLFIFEKKTPSPSIESKFVGQNCQGGFGDFFPEQFHQPRKIGSAIVKDAFGLAANFCRSAFHKSASCKIKHLIASINFFDFPLPPTLARVSLNPIDYGPWS